MLSKVGRELIVLQHDKKELFKLLHVYEVFFCDALFEVGCFKQAKSALLRTKSLV